MCQCVCVMSCWKIICASVCVCNVHNSVNVCRCPWTVWNYAVLGNLDLKFFVCLLSSPGQASLWCAQRVREDSFPTVLTPLSTQTYSFSPLKHSLCRPLPTQTYSLLPTAAHSQLNLESATRRALKAIRLTVTGDLGEDTAGSTIHAARVRTLEAVKCVGTGDAASDVACSEEVHVVCIVQWCVCVCEV
jgi:hypothetical protein